MAREHARTQFGAVGGWRFLFLVAVVIAAWQISWWILIALPVLFLVAVLFAALGRTDTRGKLTEIVPEPAIRSMVLSLARDQLIEHGQTPQRAEAMAEVFLVGHPDVARQWAEVARTTLARQIRDRQGGAESGPTAPVPPVAHRRPEALRHPSRGPQRKRR